MENMFMDLFIFFVENQMKAVTQYVPKQECQYHPQKKCKERSHLIHFGKIKLWLTFIHPWKGLLFLDVNKLRPFHRNTADTSTAAKCAQ